MITVRVLARAPVFHQRICVRYLRHGAPGAGMAAHLGALRARRPRAGVRDPSHCAGMLRAAARARPRSGHSLAQLAKPLDASSPSRCASRRPRRALRAAMPRLTEIADPVSQQVRQQYEESPYPRWVTVAPTAPEASISAHLRGLFPGAPLRDVARARSARYPGRRLRHRTAADRHRAAFPPGARAGDRSQPCEPCAMPSASPMRPASRSNMRRPTFSRSRPDRRFDMIESSGVLHHLADPMRGWATLLQPAQAGRLHADRALQRDRAPGRRRAAAHRRRARLCGDAEHDIRRCRQDLLAKRGAARSCRSCIRRISTAPAPAATCCSTCRSTG